MSMIENLEFIKNFGIRNLMEREKYKWTCNNCGDTICVHDSCCAGCGKKDIKLK